MSRDATFSIIVPVRDDLDCLERTLPRIIDAMDAYGDAELIVVDNGSEDGSYEWIRGTHGHEAKLLRLPGATIAAVRNYGATHARGDVLCFIDADCVVGATHLTEALRALKESAAAVVGSRYDLPADPGWVEATWQRLHRTEQEGYVNFLSAGNLIVRAEAFEEVGGFDEELVTGEDSEFCERLRHHGYRIYQDPAIVAVHLGNAKTLRGFFRKQRWYALGMFGTVEGWSLDKPVAAMLVHVLLVGSAVAAVFATPVTWALKLGLLLAALLLIPSLAVVYRCWQVRRVVRPAASVLLYELFFAARITAVGLLLTGLDSGWRPSRERGSSRVRTAYEFERG